MSNRKGLIIQKYGPSDEYRVDAQEEYLELSCENSGVQDGKESTPIPVDIFRLSIYHMKLSLSDGIPHLITIPNSISEQFMYIGSAGGAYNLDALLAARISHVICLTSIVKSAFPDHFQYLRINMRDNHTENLYDRFMECVPFIVEARCAGGRILIHCYKGQSRSAAIICAYLIRQYAMEVNQALRIVQTARRIAQPNNHFMSALYQLYESLHRDIVTKDEASTNADPVT